MKDLLSIRGNKGAVEAQLASDGRDPLIVIAEIDEAYRTSPDPALTTLRRTVCKVAKVATHVTAPAVIVTIASRAR